MAVKVNILIDAFSPYFSQGLNEKHREIASAKVSNTDACVILGVHNENFLDKDFLFDLQFKIDEVKKLGYTNKNIKIAILEKPQVYTEKQWAHIEKVNDELLKNNIEFGFYEYRNIYDIKTAKIVIDKLKNFAEYANSKGLTPFEKIMFAYSVAQNNIYKLEGKTEGADKSRSIYSVLTNEEICCVGYSRIFECLIDFMKDDNLKVIENTIQTTDILGFGTGNHRNNVAYVKDEKYGINGVYYFDATWDCTKKEDKDTNMLKLGYFMLPLNDVKYFNDTLIRDRHLQEYPKDNKDNINRSLGSSTWKKRKLKVYYGNLANQIFYKYLPSVKDYINLFEEPSNSISIDGIRILDTNFINRLLRDETFSNIAYSLKDKEKEPNYLNENLTNIKDKVNNLDIFEEIIKEYNIEKISKKEFNSLIQLDKKSKPVYEIINNIIKNRNNPDFKYAEDEEFIEKDKIISEYKEFYVPKTNLCYNSNIENLVNLENGLNKIGLDYPTLQSAIEYFSTPVSLNKIKAGIRNIYKKSTKLTDEQIESDVNNIVYYNSYYSKNIFYKGAKNCFHLESEKLDDKERT